MVTLFPDVSLLSLVENGEGIPGARNRPPQSLRSSLDRYYIAFGVDGATDRFSADV